MGILFSPELEEAAEMLDAAKGKPQTMAERKRLSIDLAALMLKEATRTMTPHEKAIQQQLSRLMKDPVGKAFTAAMTDECFRSSSHARVAAQLIYLLQKLGVPHYLTFTERAQLFLFKILPVGLARFFIPLVARKLRKQTERVILPGEQLPLSKHLKERKAQGVRLNLNHLGEAILSEAEAKKRLRTYLDDLEKPDIDYMSVKISTIFSQINLLSWEDTVHQIAERLKGLYRAAQKHKTPKFVNLDMEEYRDLHLTVTAFQRVLDEPEFHHYSAGIVLQAYLPDSFPMQKHLTEWAKVRVRNGGAPIKIRIVKGANLAMEQFEASLKGWPQAPYTAKVEVDANYKRMVMYGCVAENARAVHLGIASHNLFDIAFALFLRVENQVEPYTGFEMLEGMADHIRRVVQKLSGNMLLYCPVATKEEFQHAIAYLIRRLDENTGPENFLRHVFGLKPGSESWENQTTLFLEACDEVETAPATPRRTQNRLEFPPLLDEKTPFENEPDTDFSLPANQKWAKHIAESWKNPSIKPLPLVIDGRELFDNQDGTAFSPNNPSVTLYHYTKATHQHIELALTAAKKHEKSWATTSLQHRSHLLARCAHKLRERRGELIGVMMADTGKIVSEADAEVSEAIDFAEYYRRQMEKMDNTKDVGWSPVGTVVVTPPWNFPCAIPAGGMLAALVAGNCVLLKPASDSVLVAWHVVNAFWDAGIPKEVLQFVPCSGDGAGSELVKDKRVNAVILTGGTETARKFMQMRPELHLAAETGGKNSLIVTAMSDRDLAIKDLMHSAFSHSGQKCSAASLAVLEAEVYDDVHFLRNLKEAVASLKVGPSYDLTTKINPLIHEPRGVLKRGLTTLEPGEQWLLEPKQDPTNPCLWSPGIKLGVQPGGFTHMTELFGPVLGLMRAKNLTHALELANAVPYGLTSGLHSLDDREQALWTDTIQAGNLYINRTTTGAIVRRQPFGGCKASSFGGGSKAGGPNYLREVLIPRQANLPQHKEAVNQWVNSLTTFLEKIELSAEQLGLWTASVANYAYWAKRLSQDRDPAKIVGQDNFFRYVPRKKMALRIERDAKALDTLRICAAALSVGAGLEVSWSKEAAAQPHLEWLSLVPVLRTVQEDEGAFVSRLHAFERVRLAAKPSDALRVAAAKAGVYLIEDIVLASGRWELLHYLQEVSLSVDYHRYGNLGLREGELRKQIL